jgi:hypothetical protein
MMAIAACTPQNGGLMRVQPVLAVRAACHNGMRPHTFRECDL